jgi:hypothetical protein
MITDQRISEIAFALSTLTPEQRHDALVWAFRNAVARSPHLADGAELDPRVVWFVGAIYRKIAEFEQRGGSA